MTNTTETRTTRSRRIAPLAALGLAAAALLSACSSSSSTPTTTTTAPGGTLSSNNAAFLAADLKAPAGTLNASGSTFVQPFFTSAFYAYTGKNQGLQVNYQGVGSGAGITAFEQGSVAFAASDVPMGTSDLAKVPASSGPVVQVPDILGGVAMAYNVPGVSARLKLDAATIAFSLNHGNAKVLIVDREFAGLLATARGQLDPGPSRPVSRR